MRCINHREAMSYNCQNLDRQNSSLKAANLSLTNLTVCSRYTYRRRTPDLPEALDATLAINITR
jgi:hypothetical protein